MILCRRTFLFTVLNGFFASIRSATSVSCSLKISCVAWAAALVPASWPAQTCSEPTDSVISSRIVDTTTLPAIHWRISPIPIGRKPRFLSRGINLYAKNASKDSCWSSTVHNFCIILKNCLLIRILHLSASVDEGLEPPIVFRAAFLTNSSVIFSNLIA